MQICAPSIGYIDVVVANGKVLEFDGATLVCVWLTIVAFLKYSRNSMWERWIGAGCGSNM
jgi:hypothetical protein